MSKLKLGLSGMFSVFLQHYQTWMYMCKRTNYCKLQVTSLRRFTFATFVTVASLRSRTYPLRLLDTAIRNHSTCSTFSPFRCSDYMTTPIIFCLRPPGKRVCTILHAMSSLPARWTPLVERKPDSKESGIMCRLSNSSTRTVCLMSCVVPSRTLPVNISWAYSMGFISHFVIEVRKKRYSPRHLLHSFTVDHREQNSLYHRNIRIGHKIFRAGIRWTRMEVRM